MAFTVLPTTYEGAKSELLGSRVTINNLQRENAQLRAVIAEQKNCKQGNDFGAQQYEELRRLHAAIAEQKETIETMRGVSECHAIDLRERDGAIKHWSKKASELFAKNTEQKETIESLTLWANEVAKVKIDEQSALIEKLGEALQMFEWHDDPTFRKPVTAALAELAAWRKK